MQLRIKLCDNIAGIIIIENDIVQVSCGFNRSLKFGRKQSLSE